MFAEGGTHSRLRVADDERRYPIMERLAETSLSSAADAACILGAAQVAAPRSVLVVEDDVALARFLCRELQRSHYATAMTHDAEAALEEFAARPPDMMIVDLNLPRMDGMELLARVRGSQPRLPILVLTARSRATDRVQALEGGADDCLIKPFSCKELLLRMGVLLRREGAASAGCNVGDLSVYRDERRVMRGERRIDLTPREFAILEHLLDNAGRPVSRTVLMREVWNLPLEATSNIVDVYMKYLRDKIDYEGAPKLIRTVRGIGYVLGSA